MSHDNLHALVVARQGALSLISTHGVLRNTYGLLCRDEPIQSSS